MTSRSRLASLIATEGARPLLLDLLSAPSARDLLGRRLGPDRVAGEPEAVDELIERCAKLPLALSVVAARAASQPRFPLAVLAGELRNAQGPLDALGAGELAADVRTVFSWSYQSLDAWAALMFRMLGLHPGPDISAAAAASLAGFSHRQARQALAELAQASLVVEHVPGRFACHDLLRAYAAEQSHDVDEAARAAAIRRMLDHYLHTAHQAALLLSPSREPLALAAPQAGTVPEVLTGYLDTWTWFDTEYRVLLAVIDLAAQRADDLDGQARAHRDLGYACVRLGACADARTHLRQSLGLHRELGNRFGQASAHRVLAQVDGKELRYRKALGHAEQALELYRAAGNRAAQAKGLNSAGWYHALLGDQHRAIACCRQALDTLREVGDQAAEADVWDSQADVLICLGDLHHGAGSTQAARDTWRQALTILDRLHHPDADAIRARLQANSPGALRSPPYSPAPVSRSMAVDT